MNDIERAIESTKNRIFYITEHAKDGTPSHCVKAEKQEEIQKVILDALERSAEPTASEFLRKAKAISRQCTGQSSMDCNCCIVNGLCEALMFDTDEADLVRKAMDYQIKEASE